MLRSPALAVVSVTFLAACNQDGTIRQNTAGGAAIGALAGAGIGALIGDRRGALIGAGVGAIAGAGVGNYLDEQQAQLESDLSGTGATVTNTGEELFVNLPSEITFDVDRAEIKPEFRPSLVKIANTLNQYEASVVDVIGHTDSTGSEAYNQDLSERRADKVAGLFVRRGVIPERIEAFGRGETAPVATNETAAGRAQNRRVEIVITPITEG